MSLTDYSEIEKEIREAPEPQILPKDTEVKARIVAVNSGVSDTNNAKWYSVVFDVPDEPLCPMFSDFFWDLVDRDKLTEKQYVASLHQFKSFAEAFGIDYSRPFSWEDDLPGLEGWMILKVVRDKDGQYPDKNGVKKYIAGPSTAGDQQSDPEDIPF